MLRLNQRVVGIVAGLVVLVTLMLLLRDTNRPFVPNSVGKQDTNNLNHDIAGYVPPANDKAAEAAIEEAEKIEHDGDDTSKKPFEDTAEKIQQEEDAKKPPVDQKPSKDEVAGTTGALKYFKLVQDPDNPPTDGKVRASFVTLARNSDLYQLIELIKGVEDRFNHKFNYDWVFLNDEEFSDEFKQITTALISGKTKYGVIPKEHWSYPSFIDQEKAALVRQKMKEDKIIYGDLELYRHMCRFELGFFWRNPLMEEYDWYWRVEPDTTIYCDLDYDLFKYMQDNQKVYGFAISIREFVKTIPTLWDSLKLFVKSHPDYIADDNAMEFISDDNGQTYNLCHYWSNFEVANLNFWRSQPYVEYFDHLDRAGGFFYERWGDAPIHSIAASLFLPKDKIHYFEDIGYRHGVYTQCPVDPEYRTKHKCYCNPDKDFTFRGYSCGKQWHDVFDHPKMKGWEKYT